MRSRFTKEKVPWQKKLLAYGGFDFPFMVIVTILLCLGLVLMFSASYVYAFRHHQGNAYHFIQRQAIWAVLGFAAMLIISKMNLNLLRKLAIPAIVVSVVLLVIALVQPGSGDFNRWIVIPLGGASFQFQPSEVAKVGLIVFFAYAMEKFQKPSYAIARDAGLVSGRKTRLRRWLVRWWPTGMYMGVLFVLVTLVLLGNHVSGMIIIGGIGVLMIFIGEQRIPLWFYIIGIGIAVVAVLAVFRNPHILPEHAARRIIAFQDPMSDPTGSNWQTIQSLLAVGSGGWFGQGWGRSVQKHLYLPEPQNDFVFAIVAEELGFIGAMLILLLFVALVWRGFMIALHTKDRFGSLLVLGIVLQVGLQTALNVGVVTAVIPNTGIPLPFFSYGGTALWFKLISMGIILSVSREIPAKRAG